MNVARSLHWFLRILQRGKQAGSCQRIRSDPLTDRIKPRTFALPTARKALVIHLWTKERAMKTIELGSAKLETKQNLPKGPLDPNLTTFTRLQ